MLLFSCFCFGRFDRQTNKQLFSLLLAADERTWEFATPTIFRRSSGKVGEDRGRLGGTHFLLGLGPPFRRVLEALFFQLRCTRLSNVDWPIYQNERLYRRLPWLWNAFAALLLWFPNRLAT